MNGDDPTDAATGSHHASRQNVDSVVTSRLDYCRRLAQTPGSATAGPALASVAAPIPWPGAAGPVAGARHCFGRTMHCQLIPSFAADRQAALRATRAHCAQFLCGMKQGCLRWERRHSFSTQLLSG